MGRVYTEIRENGHGLWTLFDTGAKNSYILRSALGSLTTHRLAQPMRVAIGGQDREFDEVCIPNAYIEGKFVNLMAYVIDQLGNDDHGRTVEMLFGALAMQQWCIFPMPHEDRLDLSHYTGEFTEY
ncbi:MAG: hypothetical protein HY360_22470 [Verrucomicrobia bacterium]|nr:hypothetical protein [Verrucomicrobiota bacterium]